MRERRSIYNQVQELTNRVKVRAQQGTVSAMARGWGRTGRSHRAESMGDDMRHYEVMLILDPSPEDEDAKGPCFPTPVDGVRIYRL